MRVHLASIALLTIASAGVSCAANDATHPGVDAGPSLDAATASDGGDDGASDDGNAGPTQAMVRFAQVSPDAPPLDVCLAAHGTGAYQGPLLARFAADAGLSGDASAPGLSFTDVSAYVAIEPGAYDVRLVAAGVTSCAVVAAVTPSASASADAGANVDAEVAAEAGAGGAAEAGADADERTPAASDADTPAGPPLPPAPDTTNLPAFVAGGFTTVLLAGELAPVGNDAPLRAVAVHDEVVLAGGAASLRAINALGAVAQADFGFGSFSGSWSPLFTNVAFGAASVMAAPVQGKADADGYLTIAPFGPGVFSVRSSSGATADVASSPNSAVSLAEVATIIAAGGKAGDPAHPPVLVLCADGAPSGGPLSVCSVLR